MTGEQSAISASPYETFHALIALAAKQSTDPLETEVFAPGCYKAET